MRRKNVDLLDMAGVGVLLALAVDIALGRWLLPRWYQVGFLLILAAWNWRAATREREVTTPTPPEEGGRGQGGGRA